MPFEDTADVTFGSKSLPQRLIENNLNLDCLRTYTLLREDEWEMMDDRLIATFNDRLNGIQDLRDRNLTQDLGGLGTVISKYEQISDMDEAEVFMDTLPEPNYDRQAYSPVSVPVPLIGKTFQFSLRHLLSSRRGGEALDTTQGEAAARKVAEQLENILFNGNTTVMGGNPIHGYRTHPNRNTTTGATWATATNIYPDVLSMITLMHGDKVPGPFILYLHPNQYVETLEISDTTRVRSELQVVVDSIPELDMVKFSDKMTDGEAVMVSMNRDTVELGIAEEFAPYEWETQGGLALHFRVMTAAVPKVKADYDGKCGIVHMTGI